MGRGESSRGRRKHRVRTARQPCRFRGSPEFRHDMKSSPQIDRTLTLVVLAILIVGCFLVLQPFLTAVIWAAILCATSWPLYVRLRKRFHRQEWLAATLMLVLITILLFAPFVIVGATIAHNADAVEARARGLI